MDEDESARASPFAGSGGAFLAATLGTVSDNPRVDALLERQIALADLQIDGLQKVDAFELSHLRWRRFNDQMKGALQIMAVVLGLAVVIGIAVAVWRASQADGMVVEAFSVPPALAQNGMGGDVVADDLTNKLAAVRDTAVANSLSVYKDVRQDRDNDIKVEIPETGISLAQAWRYLRQWFGHERPLTGNVRRTADGKIALAVTLDRQTFVARGALGDLDALEQKIAEQVFAADDPGNYVLYLNGMNRDAEAYAAAGRNVTLSLSERERAGAYSLWANETHFATGDVRLGLTRAWISIALYGKSSAGHMEAMSDLLDLGHEEEALAQARIIATLRQADENATFRESGFPYAREFARYTDLLLTGDFAQARSYVCIYTCTLATQAARRAEYAARAHDIDDARTQLAQGVAAGGVPPDRLARAQYFIALAATDWPAAVTAARAYAAGLKTVLAQNPTLAALRIRTAVQPMLATALARIGDVRGAQAAIDATPLDCYDCLRARGAVYDARWYSRAVALAPSLPFAYADWGQMLLAKGDLAGAIAKFSRAHDKGPRFADPLEMWGEALIAQNRSDLALAKFQEAAQYAPNWGRLHLKWGEALLWSGDSAAAQKQFALAAPLDLTDAERHTLAGLRI